MKGREVLDLQGHRFIMGDFSINMFFPKEFQIGAKLTLTSDTLSPFSFILARWENGLYGYIYYANEVYVYGMLELIKYEPSKDIRHVKEQT